MADDKMNAEAVMVMIATNVLYLAKIERPRRAPQIAMNMVEAMELCNPDFWIVRRCRPLVELLNEFDRDDHPAAIKS